MNMKLSQFKTNTVKKTLRFARGEHAVLEADTSFNGEIHFYEITQELIIDIHDNVMSKLGDVDFDDIEFAYAILPHICDIEVDITLEEFNTLVDNPSKQFLQLLELIMSSIQELLEMINSMSDIVDKAKDLNVDMKSIKESQLEKLYEQLPKTTNRQEMTRIMTQIQEIEAELKEIG